MFDPAEASRQIKREFIDYITTSDRFTDVKMRESFYQKLNEQQSKGPIVDIKDAFKPSKSIEELIAENVLTPEFRNLEGGKPAPTNGQYSRKLPLSRPLYAHQEQAVRRICAGRSAIVTTGTGSGKTECFLIPVLNELLKQVHDHILPESGVQAILIYPMNALANDQMKRLRELLLCYPKIRFGVYSGDTKETQRDALKRYHSLHVNDRYAETRIEPIPNEIISREEMREAPPHILCTNYAMLERLLLRPQDNDLFAKSDIRFVVLDEAHVYHGATGIETAFLLRRLKARIHAAKVTRFILTSATLGTQGESDHQVLDFGKNLTGTTYEMDDIIYGQRVVQSFDETIVVPLSFFKQIASRKNDDKALTPDELKPLCVKLDLPYDDAASAAENLFNTCFASSIYQTMRQKIHQPIALDRFAETLGVDTLQAIQFLHVLTQAYKNETALIDVRYHFFMRALEGAYYAPGAENGEIYLTRRNKVSMNGVDYAAFEIAVCSDCGKIAIVGKESDPDNEGLRHIEPVEQYEKQKIRYYFIGNAVDSEEIETEDLTDETEEIAKTSKKKQNEPQIVKYHLCTICGCVKLAEDGEPDCHCAEKKCISVFAFDEAKRKCACCGTGKMLRIFLPNHLATTVLGTSLFETLKTRTITEYVDGMLRTREGGRQFLAFSDSRSEAAFFAPCLSQYYYDFLRRRGIASLMIQRRDDLLHNPSDLYTVSDLADDLKALFKDNETFNESLVADGTLREREKLATKHAWIAVLQAMLTSESRDSLTAFGFLQFVFRPHYDAAVEDSIITKLAALYHTDDATMEGLLNHLLATVIVAGALTFKGKDTILDPDDKKFVFYTEQEREIVENITSESRTCQIGWLPRHYAGKADKYYKNARQALVMRALELTEEQAVTFLKIYYDWLMGVLARYFRNAGMLQTFQLPLALFEVLVPGQTEARWYRCSRCGRVTTHCWSNACVIAHCSGKLTEVTADELQQSNHYVNLYRKSMLKPLIIKEHTAQLSRSEGAKFQDDFEKNKINALSCSTTFEMGVDVGDLETVFLRNVPPSAANYAQRAGRAGRSKHVAAYALTYAKLSSHDFTFFNQPDKLISGIIQPPIFKLNNEKILNRHIYAVTLAYLFHANPNFYGNGKMKTFIDYEGNLKLHDLVNNQPASLTSMLKNTFASAGEDMLEYALSYRWAESLIGVDGALTETINEFTGVLTEYDKEYARVLDLAKTNGKMGSKLTMISRQKELYQNERLIDMFSRHNVLPRYGFPVDTVELTPLQDVGKATTAFGDESSKLQMQRDLKLAISEYAPGAKVIAGGNMYISRYVRKAFMSRGETNDFRRGYVYCCTKCKSWNYNQVKKDTAQRCVLCGEPLCDEHGWEYSLEPREGFFTEQEVQKVPRERPTHPYTNNAAYIGDGSKLASYRYTVGDHSIILSSSSKDRILITSKQPFYICHACGYGLGPTDTIKNKNGRGTDKAKSEDLRMGKKSAIEVVHPNLRSNPCIGTTLYREYFHHIFETDVVHLEFDRYVANDNMRDSVIQALIRAIAIVLDIEETEIAACPGYSRDGLSIIFYDTAAGGAGHVHRLLKPETVQAVLQKTLQIVSECHCDSSCYSCLRSYANQRIHEHLDRHFAMEYLTSFTGDSKSWKQCEFVAPVENEDVSDAYPAKTYQSETVHILQDGIRLGDDLEEIFDALEDEVEAADVWIVQQLKEESNDLADVTQPYGSMSLKIGVDGDELYPLIYWPESKVMLTYHAAEKQISALIDAGWHVISLDEKTTCKKIREMIRG